MASKYRLFFFLLIGFCWILFQAHGQEITGTVFNSDKEPVPYATVFVRETRQGTITNTNGLFKIQLPKGIYHLTIRSLGYLQTGKEIDLRTDSLHVDVILGRQEFQIKEVKVFPGKEDPAYFIVRKAMAQAAYYREKIKHYEAELYIKSNFTFTNIPKLYRKTLEIDGQELGDVLKEDRTYVIESFNKITFDYPGKYKQEVLAKKSSLVGFDEPPVMGLITANFYEERPNQVISPLSPLALQHYNYRYEGFISAGNLDVFKIKVEPKRKSGELVNGYMYIVDQLWCLYSVDFNTRMEFFEYRLKQQYENLDNNNWLPVSHLIEGRFSALGLKGEFNYGASLNYSEIEENDFAVNPAFSPDSMKVEPKVTDEKEKELRQEVAQIVSQEKLTNRDVKKVGRLNRKILKEQYRDSTFAAASQENYKLEDKPDSIINERAYWDTIRTIPFTQAELRGYEIVDSLRSSTTTAEDSIMKSEAKKKQAIMRLVLGHSDFCPDSLITFGYGGLLAAHNYDFNTVDGNKYRQTFRLKFQTDSGKFISFIPEIGYAFNRKTLFWKVESQLENILWKNNSLQFETGKLSRDFKPEGFGVTPDLNAMSAWVFGKNYLKLFETSFVSLNMQQKVVTNLTVYAGADFNHFFPLENHTSYNFSDKKEYEPNVPEGLTKNSEALAEQKSFEYEIGAAYQRSQKKPWLETSDFLFISDFYSINVFFKKGVPGPFSSNADFSRIELNFRQLANISPVAGIDWYVNAGTFISNTRLHFSQFKHFRTAESPVSFRPFTHTFQLINDYRYSTTESYVTAGAEYRTEYLLLRYLSFLNQRTWSESLHLNYLSTPALQNYWEAGYSLNNLFFLGNVGVFAAFNGNKFEAVEVKVSVSGL